MNTAKFLKLAAITLTIAAGTNLTLAQSPDPTMPANPSNGAVLTPVPMTPAAPDPTMTTTPTPAMSAAQRQAEREARETEMRKFNNSNSTMPMMNNDMKRPANADSDRTLSPTLSNDRPARADRH
jgi:hypothetical protein